MKTVVKTKYLSKSDWLSYRAEGIGGSDVSVIAGINPFKSIYQLWLEKTGQVELVDEGNEYTHFGTVLEPIVRREFMDRTGLKIRQCHRIYQSDKYPWMFANLDGMISLPDGSKAVFEAKTASAFKKEVWEQGVPQEYVLQIQHYLCVTGFQKAYICALIGGNHFIYHEVMRDETLISQIIAMEKFFWINNVKGGIEPVADGSDATTAYLNSAFEVESGKAIELSPERKQLELENVLPYAGRTLIWMQE